MSRPYVTETHIHYVTVIITLLKNVRVRVREWVLRRSLCVCERAPTPPLSVCVCTCVYLE